MRVPISNRDYERLSAYVDGQLNSREKNSLEESIKLRPDLQVELADLRQMKALLQMVPHKHAPRNFTLTQAMVGDFNKNRLQTRIAKYFPALSFASALATLALVASLLFQWLPAAQSLSASPPLAKEVAMQPTAAQDSSLGGEEGSPLLEPPALLESADSAADAESTAVVNLMEAPAAAAPEDRKSANQVEATLPPMITWNNAGEGIGGNGIAEENPSDLSAKGMGSGGGGTGIPGPVLLLPDGSIVVPLEGINSIEQTQPAIESESFPQEDSTYQDTGPILGIPPADQGGEIVDQFAWGAPSDDEQIMTSEQAPESQAQTTSYGAPIWILQMVLAVVAILSGVTAFYIRKQR